MRKRYGNMDGIENNHAFLDGWRWMKERRSKQKDLSVQIPAAEQKLQREVKQNRTKTTITWMGHSTFLIQMNGLAILTDPVWARRMGFAKRLTEPGWPLAELPEIEIVVISHGHYDHLDFPTLRQLKGNPHFFVPVGLKRLFAKKGYANVTELSWWEAVQHKDLELHFVPAQHWTRRTPFDTNTSHWGGWVLRRAGETLYFVGDTGYFRGFAEIGSRFDIDIALVPIGAYEPEWFMGVSHMTPEEAVQGFLDMRAKTFIPMHYGAYRLADDTGPEALARLLAAWEKAALPKERLRVLAIGETLFAEQE
ncbi:MBL fold metallo-hydrolase [Brevibacillus fluminis]|uniref:MBL fold metallo-hydrolase n=1 Tax=Brevibacillus fluminis TaxID=511487 RepID=UPI003F88EDE3